MDRSVALPLLLAPVIGALLLGPAPNRCAASCGCDRQGDRILLISTRPVGCSTDAATLANGVLACEKLSGKWSESTAESLLGSLDPTLPTIFYVHGNQISACDARKRGLDVYRRLVCCACDDRSIQFVIFSWCSDKIRGPLHDFRVKAARTRLIAGQLAWAVNQTPADAQVGLLGYSYGARVITGATHLLGGGSLGCLAVEDNSPERMREIERARLEAVEVYQRDGMEAFAATEYARMPERTSGTVGAEQAAYFRRVIADNADVRWTFVFTHKPAWQRDGEKEFASIESELLDRPYTVFYGHTHVYGYSQRNGRDYINLATTGGEQFPEKGRSMDHLMLVTVDGSGVSMANLLMAGILDKKGRTPLGLDPRVFEHRPDEG